ncbi:MAG: ATP phosphoribosyltransferase regulatory subunit [Gammaproteobacteria bacterium]
MSVTDRWLLPEGIDELLPPAAARIERLRRDVLDLFACWGYELIMPPLIEYLDSLLTGLGTDLDLQTFKLIDQRSGRLLGIRADTTPQAARIDAHRLGRDGAVRLCYLNSVLHAQSGGGEGTRNPLQLGAELYGHAGIESDAEIVSLLLAVLRLVGAGNAFLNLSHIGIFRGLADAAGLDPARGAELFEILQRKAEPDLVQRLEEWRVPAPARTMLTALVDLNGGLEVLARARRTLAGGGGAVLSAVDQIERLAGLVARSAPHAVLHVDLAEMRGFGYHTGIMFEAFLPGIGRSVAWGGRYDDIGRVFGRARPATGFSADLKVLAAVDTRPAHGAGMILAPADEDADLLAFIDRLRGTGERVLRELPGQAVDPVACGCDRRLAHRDGGWRIEPL